MKKVEKYEWIIGRGGTEIDGVDMHRFYGSEQQAKSHLVKLASLDRKILEAKGEICDDAIEDIEDVLVRTCNGSLYAFTVYYDFHIDYEATRLDKMEVK